MLSTLICPNTHTEKFLVCVLGQISVLNTLPSLQCMKSTELLTLSAHNLEKMMTTPYPQHSYQYIMSLRSSVPVSQLMLYLRNEL